MTAIRFTKLEASIAVSTCQATKAFSREAVGKAAPVRLSTTPLCLAVYLAMMNSTYAAEGETLVARVDSTLLAFNTSFLNGQGRPADLSTVLSSGSSMPPGNYRVEVEVNGNLVGCRDIDFYQDTDKAKLHPCLTAKMLQDFGVNLSAISPPLDANNQACLDPPHLLDQASVDFDAGRLQSNLSILQVFLSRVARSYIDPALWDEGINAGYVNYQFSGNYDHGHIGINSSSYFVGLQNGVSIGRWRLRNESTLTGNNSGQTCFKSNRTFVQRGVNTIKGQLTLGEQYSDTALFDSVRFRGMQITSDDAMLPDSERGYAPVVCGQAATSAVVEVRQSGYVPYRANASPDLFQLIDIFPSGSNGDLGITVTEADGSKYVAHQVFPSLPLMPCKGHLKYSFAAGKYDGDQDPAPNLVSGLFVYGLTGNSTMAGGLQVSRDFRALNVGVGTSTPVGALLVDITQPNSRV